MVRRADDHTVDVLAGEHVAEVGVRGADLANVVLVRFLAERLAATLAAIDRGHETHVVQGQKILLAVRPAAGADSDGGQAHAVAGGIFAQ